MKSHLIALAVLLFAPSVHAQWVEEVYSLKPGWNAVYLHGDASHATPEQLFPAAGSSGRIEQVWRWNSNPNQMQFIESPSIPTNGTPEWSVWTRGGAANSLVALTGQTAYLLKVSGSGNFNLSIPQRPLPPLANWVRTGANLLGFPTAKNGTAFPSFASYFATFPAAIAANTKVFQYIGGEMSASNPQPLYSTLAATVDRSQAYWFSSEVVGNFYAPLQVTLSNAAGLDFGRTGSQVTARLLNRSATAMSVLVSPQASAAVPSGQETIRGMVPLTSLGINPTTGEQMQTAITGTFTVLVPAKGSLELNFGIDRSLMGTSTGSLFASLLRFKDSANTFDIAIPATARKASLAGLWVGEASVSAVESKAEQDAVTPTRIGTRGGEFPLRYILHVDDAGETRLLSQAFLGTLAGGSRDFGICTAESALAADAKASATRLSSVHLPLNLVAGAAAGSGGVSTAGTLTRTVTLRYDDPTNPFVHQYHPDHDNYQADGSTPLPVGIESYQVSRVITFTFTAAPLPGSAVGWGSSVIGGTYREEITGLHKDSLTLSGVFQLRRVSELGQIRLPASVTPGLLLVNP